MDLKAFLLYEKFKLIVQAFLPKISVSASNAPEEKTDKKTQEKNCELYSEKIDHLIIS